MRDPNPFQEFLLDLFFHFNLMSEGLYFLPCIIPLIVWLLVLSYDSLQFSKFSESVKLFAKLHNYDIRDSHGKLRKIVDHYGKFRLTPKFPTMGFALTPSFFKDLVYIAFCAVEKSYISYRHMGFVYKTGRYDISDFQIKDKRIQSKYHDLENNDMQALFSTLFQIEGLEDLKVEHSNGYLLVRCEFPLRLYKYGKSHLSDLIQSNYSISKVIFRTIMAHDALLISESYGEPIETEIAFENPVKFPAV